MSFRTNSHRAAAIAAAAAFLVLALAAIPGRAAGPETRKANYDLASRWTPAKVGKLVFDTAVMPHWLSTGDRFWYTYQTRDGRRFYIVDAPRKSKAPLFDHAKMAATLTAMIGQPYDAQHLPFSSVRFVKKDVAFQFDVQVPRDLQINAKPVGGPKKTTAPSDVNAASGEDSETSAVGADDQARAVAMTAGKPYGHAVRLLLEAGALRAQANGTGREGRK